MAKALSLMLAQLNLTVGAIEDNCDKVLAAAAEADRQGADLLVCSELALTGYPPEDLLLRPDFYRSCAAQLDELRTENEALRQALVNLEAKPAPARNAGLRGIWVGGKCRLLLPGACEPRLTRLSARALVSILRTAYAASATGARLSLATVHFAPITVVAHRDKDQLVHSLSILFHPHRPPTKGIWWRCRLRSRVQSS